MTEMDSFDLELKAAFPGGRGRTTTPVSVRLADDQIEHLKMLARYVAYHRDEEVSYVDLIREALDLSFPVPLSGDDAAKQKLMLLSKSKLTENERKTLVNSYVMSRRIGEVATPEDFMNSFVAHNGVPPLDLGEFTIDSDSEVSDPIRCVSYIIQAGSVNRNGDVFAAFDMCRPMMVGQKMGRAYEKWRGVPVFQHADNSDITKAIGKVYDVWWDEQCAGVRVLFDLYLDNAPELRRAIKLRLPKIRFSVTVESSVCSVCGNVAHKDANTCEHIRNSKGSGGVFEINYGVLPQYLFLSAD